MCTFMFNGDCLGRLLHICDGRCRSEAGEAQASVYVEETRAALSKLDYDLTTTILVMKEKRKKEYSNQMCVQLGLQLLYVNKMRSSLKR